jgi:hypothetical protein
VGSRLTHEEANAINAVPKTFPLGSADARAIGKEAYIYGYPMGDGYRIPETRKSAVWEVV